jgi:DNA-directed RNA polymerase subunit RPC12/RpoP
VTWHGNWIPSTLQQTHQKTKTIEMSTNNNNNQQPYLCHECQQRFLHPRIDDDQELHCTTCDSTFIEQLEQDGNLYSTSEDSMLDSAIDNVLNDDDQNQQQQQQQVPRASPNLHPNLQNLFNNAIPQVTGQQPDFVQTFNQVFNGMLGSIFGPPPTTTTPTTATTTQGGTGTGTAPNVFSFDLSQIFGGTGGNGGANGGGLRFGDYFLGDNLDTLIGQLIDHTGRVGTPPASKRAMDTLPILKASHELGHHERECTICQDHYQDGDEVVELPCKHLFHKDCLWPWLNRHATCPTCRYTLETMDASPNPNAYRENNQQANTQQNPNNPPRGAPINLQDLFGGLFGNMQPRDTQNNSSNSSNTQNNNNSQQNNNSGGSGGNPSYFL